MAQRPLAASSLIDRPATPTDHRAGGPGSLRHACGIAVTGLVVCLLLVTGGCLVSLAWESSVLLAVGCLTALLVAAGAGVGFLMTRPRTRSADR